MIILNRCIWTANLILFGAYCAAFGRWMAIGTDAMLALPLW